MAARAHAFDIVAARRGERGAELVEQQAAEAFDHAQRSAKVVRDRIPERFELLVGGFELGGAFLYALLELLVEKPDLCGRTLALGDIARDALHGDRNAVAQHGPRADLERQAPAIFGD